MELLTRDTVDNDINLGFGSLRPLSIAAHHGHAACVAWLVSMGANPGDALCLAAHQGHEEVVGLLSHTHALPLAVGPAAVIVAARRGHLGCVKRLLPVVGVGYRDVFGVTALHASAGSGCVEIVQFLLECGAEIDAMDSNEHTPLYNAIAKERRMCALYLMDRGAQLELVQSQELRNSSDAGDADEDDDEEELMQIPEWAYDFEAQRERCRKACIAMLGLIRVRPGIGRDALTLLARELWHTRLNYDWTLLALHEKRLKRVS